ncbi:MAG: Lrp/AsnC family transcriptional regulator [Candidatus Thorarchaeota archaeon]
MLDEVDRMILDELRQDASRPVRDIASRLGLRRTTVQYRIERMRKQGIIRRVVAIPDYSAVGLPVTAIILVSYSATSSRSQLDVGEELAKIEGVFEVHVVSGTWDLIVKVRATSLQEIGDLVVNRLRKIPGVGQTVTCGCFFTLKEEP